MVDLALFDMWAFDVTQDELIGSTKRLWILAHMLRPIKGPGYYENIYKYKTFVLAKLTVWV